MNIFTRIWGFPILLDRLADKDAQIVSLKVEIQELRDRLFTKHGYTPVGEKVTVGHIPPYRSGRQRLKDMVEPRIGLLSPEEQKVIEESLTQ